MLRTIKDLLSVIFLTILIAAVLKSCIIDAYKIPSESMRSTLLVGDYLLVNKFIYGARTPQKFLYITLPQFQFPAIRDVRRGDVVVFDFPGESNESLPVRNLFLVKRCVGLPGDTIDIMNGGVRVNGMRVNFFENAEKDFKPVIVPKKGMTILVNRNNFLQWNVFIRREGSAVELRDGKVFINNAEITTYTINRNYYFVLGDNINNSSDSRVWGFVPEENIVGKAMVVYFSKDYDGIRWDRIGKIVK